MPGNPLEIQQSPKVDLPSLLVQRVARLRSKSLDQGLLRAWIGSDHFVRHIDLVKTHTAIPHISPRDIREFVLAAPKSPHEQRAIARALSDVDALLAGLDRLIAKKRDLKQAAMQQLLTGQTRLPGFRSVWEATTLIQLAEGRKELFDDGDWIESEHIVDRGIRCKRPDVAP